ncbi:MAG: hypothetical protein ONB12_02700 [candidate division KSB1 bacterium]|nr:hypothetical protein [candidate division KSB1 bacterium]
MHFMLHTSILQSASGFNICFFPLIVKLFVPNNQRRRLVKRSAFFCLCLAPCAFAAFEETTFGGRGGGTAGAAAASSWGAESVFYNPAGLYSGRRFELVTAIYRPFELADVHAGLLAVAFCKGKTAVGFGTALFGNPLYRETQLTAAAAYRLKPFDFTFGAAARCGQVAVTNYGNAWAVMIDIGVQAALTPKLFWGTALSNLTGSRLGRCKEALPQSMRFGWIFQPREGLSLHAELYKDDRFPLDLRWGMAWRPCPALTFRAGAANQPRRYSLGLSLFIGSLRFDYAFMNHLELGGSHLIGFGWE